VTSYNAKGKESAYSLEISNINAPQGGSPAAPQSAARKEVREDRGRRAHETKYLHQKMSPGPRRVRYCLPGLTDLKKRMLLRDDAGTRLSPRHPVSVSVLGRTFVNFTLTRKFQDDFFFFAAVAVERHFKLYAAVANADHNRRLSFISFNVGDFLHYVENFPSDHRRGLGSSVFRYLRLPKPLHRRYGEERSFQRFLSIPCKTAKAIHFRAPSSESCSLTRPAISPSGSALAKQSHCSWTFMCIVRLSSIVNPLLKENRI